MSRVLGRDATVRMAKLMTEPRGYQLIDPGLGLPELALDQDTQVRCLSYLMKRLPELVGVPAGVLFELIPAQYLGGPYPAIGLYTQATGGTDEEMNRLAFQITGLLEDYIQHLGIGRLLQLSEEQQDRWQDVLAPHEEALARCRDDWRH